MELPDDIIIFMLDNIENRLSYIFGRDFIITRRVSDNKISKVKVQPTQLSQQTIGKSASITNKNE